MKVLSFNACSLRTWGGFGSEEWLEWKRVLKEIIRYYKIDILMLQEVYKYEQSFINDLANFLGKDISVITTESYSNCNRNLHNAVFYKPAKFKNMEDLTQDFENYQNRNNNIQVIKLENNSKSFILVNVHLASDGNARIVSGSEHSEDLNSLEKLLTCLDKQFPNAYILAGGDFNFSYDLLSNYFVENHVLNNWLLDDELTTGKGIQTTLTASGQMGNPMDHFIYNNNLKRTIVKQAFNNDVNDPWNFALGVQHVQQGNSTVIKIGDLKTITFKDYHKTVSDHFPIVTEIDL